MKKLSVIAGSISALLIVGITLALLYRPAVPADTLVDRDTGETLNLAPDDRTTGGGSELYGTTHVFGVEKFNTKVHETLGKDAFLQDVLFGIIRYGDHRLKEAFATLTIQPATLQITEREITGSLRLGQTDEIVALHIALSNEAKHAIVTINKDGVQHGGTFVYVGGIETITSYLFTLQQQNDRSTDLLVTTSYTGYREAALVRLQSLGYTISDFVIQFSQSENPFQ